MYKTKHLQQRMSQRGITTAIVEIVEKYGVRQNEKLILNRKNCQELSRKFGEMKRVCDKMAEKGGYTLVAVNDSLITAYRLDSYSLSRN